MTQVLIQKVFDTAQIASTRSFTDLAPFFDYFGLVVDNVVRILRKGVGVADNMDAEIVTSSFVHGAALTVRVRTKPLSITVAQSGAQLGSPLYWTPVAGNASAVAVTALYLLPAAGNGQPTRSDITIIVQYT